MAALLLGGAGGGVRLPVVAASAGRPSWGSPIAVSPANGWVWVVNPDAGSVTALDAISLKPVGEVAVGQQPWSIALSPDGRTAYVVNRADGTLSVIETASRTVQATVPIGPEPGQVALSPSGARAFVTVTSDDQVAVVDTTRLTVTARLAVAPRPYAVAVSDDGGGTDQNARVYVTHFQALPRPGGLEATDDGRAGRVTVIDAASPAVIAEITLPPDAHGFPNLLAGISLAGNRAWIALERASPALPNDFKTTVFASIAAIDLDQRAAVPAESIPLNDEDIFGSAVNNPVAVVPGPSGRRLYVVPAGSDLVEVVDITDSQHPHLVKFLPGGQNPRGIALGADGRHGYVMSYLSRAVTVLDLDNLVPVATVPVTSETLDPEVARGQALFNNAADPRLAKRGWISCASCHPDGGSDGVTWRFPDGPRQSPALWNAGQTLPWHWSAALDEPQDVEGTVRTIQQGIGLLPGSEPPPLGAPIAGRSADLDALAAYLQRGIRPAAPPPPPPGAALARGREVYRSLGCPACHGGPTWTSSAEPGSPGTLDPDGNGQVDSTLHDVGTLNPLDVRGRAGFDPPTLLGVGLTAPYFHDGSMPTLEALIASGHPKAPAGAGPTGPPAPALPARLFVPALYARSGFTADDYAALAAFLRSIGPATPPVVDR